MNGDANHHYPRPAPIVECGVSDESLAADEVQERDPKRVFVRITSVRKRLLDEDNLCEKYHVDCCRYAGLLHGDEPGKTSIKATQRKAGKKEGEFVVIEITDSE